MNYRIKLEPDHVFLTKLSGLLSDAMRVGIVADDSLILYMSKRDQPSLEYSGNIQIAVANLKSNDYSKKSAQICRCYVRLNGLIQEAGRTALFLIDTEFNYRVVHFDFQNQGVFDQKLLEFLKLVEDVFPPLKFSTFLDKNTESLISELHTLRDSISTDSEKSLSRLSDSIAIAHADSIKRIDDHIKKRDDHFRDLEDQHRTKIEAEQRRITELETELQAKEASLNLKEPIGERRRIHTDLRERLIKQIESFKPSNSVNRSRIFVRVANIALIGLSIYSFVHFAQHVPAGVDAVAQNASVSNPSANFFSPAYLLVYIKMTLSAAAAFGFSLAYIRWEGRVADRLSETEFNIRDKAIDIERSAWIVETVEAMTSGGKEMPEGLIQLLGHNLFVNGSQKDSEAEQLSSFLQHLVGKKGSFETHIPGGGSVTMKADGARPKSE
jgi:hypothetical protein